MNTSTDLKMVRYEKGEKINKDDTVISEYSLNICVNGTIIVRLICTPLSLKPMVIGYLFSEGIIQGLSDIENISINEEEGIANVRLVLADAITFTSTGDVDVSTAVRTKTTGCGKQHSLAFTVLESKEVLPIEDGFTLSGRYILDQLLVFYKMANLFLSTGGVHSCALCDETGVLFSEEDISRHTAVDKIVGRALLMDIDLSKTFFLTSGRIPSDMCIKVLKCRVPIIISRSAPSDAAIEMAKKYNITLIGFARGHRMNIYSADHRVTE
jgi:FdhD protein